MRKYRPARSARAGGGALVDAPLGERGKLLVRGLLLVEVLLQQRSRVAVAHRAGPGDERAVCRHLVVFAALAGSDEAGVHRRVVEVLVHDRLALLDDALDAVAVPAAHFFVEAGEHPLEPQDVAAGFFQVRLERVAQLRRRGGRGELRQRLDQLSFGVVGVAQFIDEGVVQRQGFGHASLVFTRAADPSPARNGGGAPPPRREGRRGGGGGGGPPPPPPPARPRRRRRAR